MFWLLNNYTLKKKNQVSERDLFQTYWVKFQTYLEDQEALMKKMNHSHDELGRMTDMEMVGEFLSIEYGEVNFAKYIYIMTRDMWIIKGYWKAFYDEMMEYLKS